LFAPVTEQKRAQHEPAERDPNQDASHVVPVQGQRADPEQDDHDDEPGVYGFFRPRISRIVSPGLTFVSRA
jgi:hypothetical protein